ncbi:MAG: APC family permease [Thermoleophilia bacterium]
MTSAWVGFKRKLVGKPLSSAEDRAQRLSKKIALPVFASDAISSTAYATEEMLRVLVVAGAAALSFSLPIAAAVVALLAIVALSYQQTVRAYPSGGGAYVVSTENLGRLPGLVAGGSLLVDYVMTVAVSVSSGVAAIISAFPGLAGHRLSLAMGLVVLVTAVNLRGVRESGVLFAIPTYSFVLLCGGLVVVGTARWLLGDLPPAVEHQAIADTLAPLSVLLVLRAFAGGCSAMTGTEAISNGVPVFKTPESHNASITLGLMAAILGVLFLGITNLADILQIRPEETQTVLSQIGRSVYGSGLLYFALQIATMTILVLAANTSFAGFPRLSAVLAEHGFLPRQLTNRGDRLVYSNGIVGLGLAAIAVIAIFGADTHSMIPLYAVGVFVGFTLSQAGMVVHWRRLQVAGWQHRAALNGVGAVLTGVVAGVILVAKFTGGAYLIVISIFLLVVLFSAIRRHYDRVGALLQPVRGEDLLRIGLMTQTRPRTTVVLFVAQVNESTGRSLSFANALSPDDVHAVTIKGDEERYRELRASWEAAGISVPLVAVESPYRELVRPALAYIRSLRPGPDHMVTVVIPEFVVEHWWEAFLHNQNALRLKGALLLVPWVVVLSIPFHVQEAGSISSPDLLSSTDFPPGRQGGHRLN